MSAAPRQPRIAYPTASLMTHSMTLANDGPLTVTGILPPHDECITGEPTLSTAQHDSDLSIGSRLDNEVGEFDVGVHPHFVEVEIHEVGYPAIVNVLGGSVAVILGERGRVRAIHEPRCGVGDLRKPLGPQLNHFSVHSRSYSSFFRGSAYFNSRANIGPSMRAESME